MAGHSKGSGQKPQGIYTPGQQVSGPSGNRVRPEYLQKELQAISAASKVVDQRLKDLVEAINAAGNDLQGQIDTNDTDISNLQSDKSNVGHGHAIGDVTELSDEISAAQKVPMAVGNLWDTNRGSNIGSSTLSGEWLGLYPTNLLTSNWGNIFSTTTTSWGSNRSIEVNTAGWYLFNVNINIVDAVTNGIDGEKLRVAKYSPSTSSWTNFLAIPILPSNQQGAHSASIAVFLEVNGVLLLRNQTSGAISLGTSPDASFWNLIKIQVA